MKPALSKRLPLLIVAAIAAALAVLPLFSPTRVPAKPKDPAATAVTASPVSRRDLREIYQTVGTVAGRSEVRIVSQAEGVLQSVAIKVGSRVKRGQALARIDDRVLMSELAQAQAALARSTEELKRVRQLADKGIAETKRLEAAVAQEQMDRALGEKLQAQLSLSRFPSPFDGIVTAQFAYPGDTVRAGSPVFALADVKGMRVVVKVPDTITDRLSPGAGAVLQAEATGHAELAATLAEIYPAADPISHQTTIEIDAADAFPKLQPGALVKVRLTVSERAQALALDRRAVPDARTESTVDLIVIRDGRAEHRKVRLGLVLEDDAEVIDGLKEGDLVVLRGGNGLRDGAPVHVVGGANRDR